MNIKSLIITIIFGVIYSSTNLPTVNSLGISQYANVCYSGQKCNIRATLTPWVGEELTGKVNYRWVLASARDWKLDSCYYYRKNGAITDNTDTDIDTELYTSKKMKSNLHHTAEGYRIHLPTISGSARIKGESNPEDSLDLICGITASKMSLAAPHQEPNSKLEVTFSNGAGNLRNGRVVVKPYKPVAESITFHGSGDILSQGNGFYMNITNVQTYANELRALGSNYMIKFGDNPTAVNPKVHDCRVEIKNNNSSKVQEYTTTATVTNDRYIFQSPIDSSNSVIEFGWDDVEIDPEATTLQKIELQALNEKRGILRDAFSTANNVIIFCPTLPIQKEYNSIDTVMGLYAISQNSDFTVHAFVQTENTASTITLFVAFFCTTAFSFALFF